MKRSGDIRWGQLQIGAVVVAAILFLLWAAIKGGDAVMIGSKKSFHVQFMDVKGLVVGAPVRLNGLEVGQVEDISLERFAVTHTIDVRASVNKIAWPFIRRDSEATIAAISFFGDKFLQLSAGSQDQPAVEANGTIRGVEATDPMEVISGKNSPLTQLAPLVTHLDSLAARAARGEGSLGRAMTSTELHDALVALARDLRTLSGELGRNSGQVTGAVVRAGASIDSLERRLEGPGSMGQMLRDPALYEHLNRAAARLDSIAGEMAAGRGTLGKLARDESLYNESRAAVQDVRRILQDLQENPRKYIKISVF